MLTFRQLDDASQRINKVMAETEQEIINDMARRISRMGYVSDATEWQLSRLEAISASEAFVREKLSQALNITEWELIDLFDEAATRSLAFDDRIYKAAGYEPIPLADNDYLQQIVRAGLKKTLGTFDNLTRTTANTASHMFESVLDTAHQEIISGGFDYRAAIKNGIRVLTENGLPVITYPTGHVDYLDVAFRRATLTGVNQTAAELQIARMEEIGCDLVETTAHPGARPSHQIWQGKWFSYSGKNPKYPDFVANTGYGTGPGLCGWNCRHSFFPVIEGLSNHEYSVEKLREYNNKTVTFDGKKMDLYGATQQQRYIERMIRKWKRTRSAYDAAGLDSSGARHKISEWQTRQRDFIKQTGLRRDYFRERAGAQNLEKPRGSGTIKLDETARKSFLKKDYEDVKKYAVSNLAVREWYIYHDKQIPKMIDSTMTLREQARQAHSLRNMYREQARKLMVDRQERRRLEHLYPNETFEQTLERKMQKYGITLEEAYRDTIETATKTNQKVNERLGIKE